VLQLYIISSSVVWSCVTTIYHLIICSLVMCYSYILSSHLYFGHVLQLYITSSSVVWSCVTAIYYLIICSLVICYSYILSSHLYLVMCYNYILSHHLYFGHVLQLYIISSSVFWSCDTAIYYLIICILDMCYEGTVTVFLCFTFD